VTPENPFAGSEIPVSPEPAPPGNTEYTGVGERFPVWTLGDVFKVALIAFLAIIVCTIAGWMVATLLPAFRNVSPTQIGTDPRVIVPSQIAGYLVLVGYIYRLITTHYHMNFAEAIRWNWPEFRWPGYLFGGCALAIAIQGLSRFVPIPKQMPIDQMFRSYAAAWVMLFFGVAVAPLVEELFFRGLLFPALTRKLGLVTGILLTSFLFAVLHASQLGKAWGPVLILFVVGLTLTIVRAWSKSVAASCVVHVGYNLTLFVLLYFSSNGFRNLDKLSRP